jgi:hypothetical protein
MSRLVANYGLLSKKFAFSLLTAVFLAGVYFAGEFLVVVVRTALVDLAHT